MLFLKPTTAQVTKAKLLFQIFGQISGLQINLQKPELCITSSNASFVESLATIIQCKPRSFPITYLGLPLSDKRLTKTDFLPLVEKFYKSLSGWRASLLSVGGRLTLLNSVLSALPQYFMFSFLLPKWVQKKIEQIRKKFLWHGHKDQRNRALYMVSWDLVTRSKEQGGLGVRSIQFANYALLMKWMWQWTANEQAWWRRATLVSEQCDRPWNDLNGSSFWKSINHLQSAFTSSVRYHLGNGRSIQFWHDNWYGTPLKFLYPILYQMAQDKGTSVGCCAQENGWSFQHPTLTPQAQEEKDSLCQALHALRPTQAQDKIIWLRHSEAFSVKSAYDFLSYRPSPTTMIGTIWSLKAPLRVTVFAWLLLHNRLPTIDNLTRRGWHLPNMCQMCRLEQESIDHLFQKCALAKEIRTYMFSVFASNSHISAKFITDKSNEMIADPNEHIQARR